MMKRAEFLRLAAGRHTLWHFPAKFDSTFYQNLCPFLPEVYYLEYSK
jgi:hypothetical protein